MRSLCGLLNGNVGVVKSMLGEMTDSTNRGRAFSYWESAYGMGTIVGPMLGGFLANPVQQFPTLFGNSELFKTFPYLFPCLISSFISLLGATVGYIYMEETCPAILKQKVQRQTDPERLPLLMDGSNTTMQEQPADEEAPRPRSSSATSNSSQSRTISEIMNKSVVDSILCYAMWCLIHVMYEEVYALYVAEPLKAGGLQFTSFEIGLVLSLSGIVQLVSQLGIYPILERKLGLLNTYRLACVIMAVFSIALPFCTDFARSIVTSTDGIYTSGQKTAVFIMLFFLLAGKTFASVIGFIPVIIFVNDSAPSTKNLGTVHGFGQVAASLVRYLELT